MARGFIGKSASGYFNVVGKAVQLGSSVLKTPVNPVESGDGGGFTTSVGTSKNIVVDDNVYDTALGKIEQTDAVMEEKLQYIIRQIEEMCGNVFIVPETTAKVQAVLDTVKGTMAEFRGLTKQMAQITQMYVSQINANDR